MENPMQYIERRMKAKGIENFHVEPVSAFAESEQFVIQAYNEFYFLLNENLNPGTIIQSDTEILFVKPNLLSTKSGFLKEFTGHIFIQQTQTTGQTFEFLKVIPE
jgi:hypothetical protein